MSFSLFLFFVFVFVISIPKGAIMSRLLTALDSLFVISIPKGAIMRSPIIPTIKQNNGISIPKGAIMSYFAADNGLQNVDFNSKRCDYEPAGSSIEMFLLYFNSKRCDYDPRLKDLTKSRIIISIPKGAIMSVPIRFHVAVRLKFQFQKVRL